SFSERNARGDGSGRRPPRAAARRITFLRCASSSGYDGRQLEAGLHVVGCARERAAARPDGREERGAKVVLRWWRFWGRRGTGILRPRADRNPFDVGPTLASGPSLR